MLSDVDSTVTVGTDNIQPSIVVRDLIVLLDSALSMKKHVAQVTSMCFNQLRRSVTSHSTFRWTRSQCPAGPCVHSVAPRLWQLEFGWSTEVDDCSVSARPKRRCPPYTEPRTVRPRHLCLETTPLAYCPRSCSIQAVDHNALYPRET